MLIVMSDNLLFLQITHCINSNQKPNHFSDFRNDNYEKGVIGDDNHDGEDVPHVRGACINSQALRWKTQMGR